jgi:hypothetical protein
MGDGSALHNLWSRFIFEMFALPVVCSDIWSLTSQD